MASLGEQSEGGFRFRRSQAGLLDALLAQPAAWTVPTAFVAMIVVSLLTRRTVPRDAGRILVRLHAPEGLGLHTTGYGELGPTSPTQG